MSDPVTAPEKWQLHSGCHRGTLTSRDSRVVECSSLEECRNKIAGGEEFYRSIGYYMWFAYAVGPDGQKTTLHPGTPYVS
jgi:hypothetical protein